MHLRGEIIFMFKRVLINILAIVFSFELLSCSNSNSTSNNNSIITTAKEEITTVTTTEESSDIEVNKEEYFIYQNDIKIYGNLYKPYDYNENNSYPLIIMSHSANVNSDTLNSYAIRSSSLGYLVYTFDYPGSSSTSRSTKIELCTIFTEMENLSFIIDYFSNLTYIEEIYLFGTSQGGLVSSIVADEKEELVSGLILFYPAYNIVDTILKYPSLSDKGYVEQLKNYDVYEHIGKFRKDVLIVHGTSDFIVPYSYSQRADEIYENSTLYLVDGANHGFNKENHYFNNNYDEITWSYVIDYLKIHKSNSIK